MKIAQSMIVIFLILSAFAYSEESPESIYSQGFIARNGLANFFIKAERGIDVKVAFLGGSVTSQDGYRPQTMDWLQKTWANANFEEIDAFFPNKGSEFAAFVLSPSVLQFKPDIVFIEMSVSDYQSAKGDEEKVLCALEGIVRQIIAADPTTDICFLYPVTDDMLDEIKGGSFPASVIAAEKVASHYGLPSVNMGFEVISLEKQGRLEFRGENGALDDIFDYKPLNEMPLNKKLQIVFSDDGVHPYVNSGHVMYTQAIKNSLVKISDTSRPYENKLIEPLNPGNFEKAKMIDVTDQAIGEGWYDYEWNGSILPDALKSIMPQVKYTCLPDDTVEFEFSGRVFGLFDVIGPKSNGIACIVDDKVVEVVDRFDAYCSYYRVSSFLHYLDDDGPHKVTMMLANSFSLERKANLLAEQGVDTEDTSPYKDSCWYVGKIMLVGDMIEKQAGN